MNVVTNYNGPIKFKVSGLKWSLQFQKILKLSINFIPWMRHANDNHVFRPRSLLKDSIPFLKVGMGPEMNVAIDSCSVSPVAGQILFSRSQRQFSFAECQKTRCG